MTQEVQPLAWQKRTNLEEHQQFFAKINEIIANLAPTVNEAEAAIAQATQAVASANAAISTANAASANADAAAQQAQTAAGTVAGYDARMTAAESKNTQQDTAISALQTADGQNVKLSGNQNITGIKTVPTEATGTRSQQIANSAKIGAELDNYAAMVRTTGSQSIYGRKAFNLPVFEGSKDTFREFIKFTDVVREEATDRRCFISSIVDSNERGMGNVEIGMDNSGQRAYYSIAFGGIVVNGNYLTSQLRLNLSQSGVEMQLFDPINRTWKTAVFQ